MRGSDQLSSADCLPRRGVPKKICSKCFSLLMNIPVNAEIGKQGVVWHKEGLTVVDSVEDKSLC